MDAKKVTGMMIAVVLTVPIITSAPPGMLAVIEVGLVGLLFFVRRRRSGLEPARYRA